MDSRALLPTARPPRQGRRRARAVLEEEERHDARAMVADYAGQWRELVVWFSERHVVGVGAILEQSRDDVRYAQRADVLEWRVDAEAALFVDGMTTRGDDRQDEGEARERRRSKEECTYVTGGEVGGDVNC